MNDQASLEIRIVNRLGQLRTNFARKIGSTYSEEHITEIKNIQKCINVQQVQINTLRGIKGVKNESELDIADYDLKLLINLESIRSMNEELNNFGDELKSHKLNHSNRTRIKEIEYKLNYRRYFIKRMI